MPSICILYVTAKKKAEAKSIAGTLIDEKLAACANIFPETESLYSWKGARVDGNETVLLLKTTKSKVKKAMKRVAELHSYECPCILELPVSSAHAPFARWIADGTR